MSLTPGQLVQLASLLEGYQGWARSQANIAAAQGDRDAMGYWTRRGDDAADLRMTLPRSGWEPVEQAEPAKGKDATDG